MMKDYSEWLSDELCKMAGEIDWMRVWLECSGMRLTPHALFALEVMQDRGISLAMGSDHFEVYNVECCQALGLTSIREYYEKKPYCPLNERHISSFAEFMDGLGRLFAKDFPGCEVADE